MSKQTILRETYALAATIVNPGNSSPTKDQTMESVKPAANRSSTDDDVIIFLTIVQQHDKYEVSVNRLSSCSY
jgi:hypothetical protein